MVVDLEVLFQELDALRARGVDVSKLLVSANAHVITHYHRTIDKVTERFLGKRQIGTTGRGIGPTYADKINRVGIRIQDIFDENILRQKVEAALDQKNHLLVKVFNRRAIDAEEVVESLLSFAERLRPMVADTGLEIHRALERGETVLFEAGQATMLDVDHGTYPFVTSSSATAGGAATVPASAPGGSSASSASSRRTRPASAPVRSRPSCSTSRASSCAPTASSSAPPRDARAAAAGTTPRSPATPPASTA